MHKRENTNTGRQTRKEANKHVGQTNRSAFKQTETEERRTNRQVRKRTKVI